MGRKAKISFEEKCKTIKDYLSGKGSHEAFTRAFKGTYSVTPSEYRKKPKPVVLRTKTNPFDRYFLGLGEIGMMKSTDDVKIYECVKVFL